MDTHTSRVLLAALAVAALTAFPSTALGGSLVPPGNSAANQYTETFPTTGGNAEAKKGKHKVTAAEVIGAGNAKKLDSQGKQGREAAAVVAATAPPPAVTPVLAGGEGGQGTGGAKGDGGTGGKTTRARGPAGNGAVSGGAQSLPSSSSEEPGGSSGLGEVLGQATGSNSSGGTGLLLPLAVLATVIWSVIFLLRRNRRTA